MKRKVTRIRLSPNEEARIIREEHERRRKLRIQQVREQQRCIALQIRQQVEQRRQQELEQLERELREDWEQQQRDKLNALQELYQESLQLLGQGHRSAKENEPDLAAVAQKEEENNTKAEERYRDALKELKSQRLKDHERQNRSINARKKALQTEKERSAKVASFPPPPPNPIQNLDSKKPHIVKQSDVSAFAATHYHMSENAVDRELEPKQMNAHEEAELEARRLQDLQREEEKRREEQLEKARLRGREALRREHLVHDHERLLVELEHMQQTDLLRRRQQVSKMPPQIFQPLYKRKETREDFQREMEFAFEDMYTGERRVKGDLVVQLLPEPLPALSTGSQDQELDVTLDEIATLGTDNTQHDTEQGARSTEQETSAQVEPSKPAPRRALKKLLDRIRSQRDQWTEDNGHVSAADSPIVITDHIPERDSTIDTGSLTSEEKGRLSPTVPPEPALETAQPRAADPPVPDVIATRLQEFTEEQKKREEQLEREKQQQVVLLNELEEQKVKLEQMLLEARLERDHLKAAVTQTVPANQPEVPVHEQEETPDPPGVATELLHSSSDDDHTRRIREYQNRLLEQNRIHQRSVEVARQRLEDYQRALQLRYNVTASAMPPTAVPPRLINPPLHRAQPVHLPPSLPTTPAVPTYIHAKPQTSVEIPTKESRVLAPAHPPGSRLLSDEVDSMSNNARNERPDVSAWLTKNIMERVTEHLPEKVRPLSVTREPLPSKLLTTHHSTSIPLQPTSQDAAHAAPVLPGHTAVGPGTFLHGSSLTGSLSPREDEMQRQRWILEQKYQEEERQRRLLEQRRQEEERQRRELEEKLREEEQQRRELEEKLREEEQQRQHEEERQRWELEEKLREEERQRQHEEERQRWELEEKLREEERQRQHEEERQRWELDQKLREEERQRRELQETQRRVLEQRKAVLLLQGQQEEERQKREVAMEQMRRQKETLQALILTDAQPSAEAAHQALVSENISQTRLKLLASLLRAIEETNGGRLSHLEDPPEDRSGSPEQLPSNSDPISPSILHVGPSVSALPSGFLPPPRAAKPPVTRIKLGMMEMMTRQHELSAIPEAETPLNTSQVTGPEDSEKVFRAVDWDPLEKSEPYVVSDRTLQTPSSSSSGQQTPERPNGSGTSSEASSHLIWRERLLLGAGTSPELSEPDSRLRSPLSSDSGRGADYSGPAITSYRSPTESARRGADSDCLSSTTISTGSYITTDPEQNLNTDKFPPVSHCVEQRLDVSSSSGQSLDVQDSSAAGSPGLAVGSLFNDSSIQRIIERYTRELNISLSTTGTTTDSGGSFVEEPGSSVSQPSLVRVPESSVDEDATVCQPLPSDTAAPQRSSLEWDPTVHPVPEHTDEDPTLTEGQEEDSFRPLIGQLTEQSSCLAADHRDSAMEQLVGQPSAHSSMIGQLPGLPVSLSLDQGGWDSTLSRMIGRLTNQSSSHWLSGGQDFYAGQLMSHGTSEQENAWLDDGPEESGMRPLVGELDESSGQHSGSSGERLQVDLGVSAEASVPSFPALPLEASSHSASVTGLNPHPQDLARPLDLGSERTQGSDSFHTLLAEVTHNETAEPSMIFHLPQQDIHDSSEGEPAGWGPRVPTPSEESDPSGSEQSPERLRTEQPCCDASPALHESFSQLITSQHQGSNLALSPTTDTDVQLAALSLCDDTPAVCVRQPEEAACERGILEQSEITLVSLTDTTLQDQETTVSEEGLWEGEHPDGVGEEGQKCQEMEATEVSSSNNMDSDCKNQTHPVTLLEFQWGPSRDLQEVQQEKRRALLQRSSHRLEEIKAKRDRDKMQSDIQAPPEAGEQCQASKPPIACKAKSEPQPKTKTRSKAGQAEQHQTTVKSGGIKQIKPPCPVTDSRQKRVVEMKICTTEQRKLDVSEMHQRTQRLYEQLEEVKHQRASRSRQEAYAKNRLKAKEFHKKTLQKLRAKQTLQ